MAKRLPGESLYRRLAARLKKRRRGQIVAIDAKTGNYLIGRDELQVALRARKDYPNTLFSFFRIGYPAVHKFRTGSQEVERTKTPFIYHDLDELAGTWKEDPDFDKAIRIQDQVDPGLWS